MSANDENFARHFERTRLAQAMLELEFSVSVLLPPQCRLSIVDLALALPADVAHLEEVLQTIEKCTRALRQAFDALQGAEVEP